MPIKITTCYSVEYAKPILKLTWRTQDKEQLKLERTKDWGNIPYKETMVHIKSQLLAQAKTIQGLTMRPQKRMKIPNTNS